MLQLKYSVKTAVFISTENTQENMQVQNAMQNTSSTLYNTSNMVKTKCINDNKKKSGKCPSCNNKILELSVHFTVISKNFLKRHSRERGDYIQDLQ